MVGAYPKGGANDADIFARNLVFDLREFPRDILEQAAQYVRRTLRFLPSIAEIYQVANGLMLKRQHLLRIARGMLAEHERRAESRRVEEDARRQATERDLERREELEQLHAAVEDAFGAQAPSADDYDLALKELKPGEVPLFEGAYRALEPWAMERCRRLAAQRRAREAGKTVEIDTSKSASGKLPADNYMLAVSELRERGAVASEIETFTIGVQENDLEAQTRCAELAEAARIRITGRLPKKRRSGAGSARRVAPESDPTIPTVA